MCDQEHRAVVGSFEHVRDECLGGGAVEVCGRLVEDQHRRVGEQRPRDDETLALAARELRALLPDVRVEAVRERLDPRVEASTAQRVVKLVVRRIRSREAKVLADRRVEDVGLLPREREGPADVLLPQPADVDAVERDPARLGIEEAQEQVRDRRLPGAARADECQAAPGIEPEVEAVERRRLAGRVRGRHALQRDGDPPSRRRRGLGWIGHPRLAVGQLEHASSGGERRRELARRARQRRHRVERGQREQRECGDEDAVERAGVVRGDRHGQHAGSREAGDEHGQRVGEAGDQCVATSETHELTVGRADAGEGVVLPAVGDELRCSPQELDQLGRQLAPRGRLAPADTSPQPACEQRYRDSAEREAEREDDRGGREHECDGGDAGDRHDETDERRREAAEIEPLERVHVCDQPAHEVAAPKRVQLRRRERLDALVHARPDPPEGAQREVVRREAVEVARERSREREEADDDDDRRQRQDRRLLGCTGDEVAGGRHQRDAEADGQGAERKRQDGATARDAGESQNPRERAHAASSSTRPLSSRTILSAEAASSGACATITTVRPPRSRSIDSAITLAFTGSRSAVGSSSRTSGASRRNARARAIRRR